VKITGREPKRQRKTAAQPLAPSLDESGIGAIRDALYSALP